MQIICINTFTLAGFIFSGFVYLDDLYLYHVVKEILNFACIRYTTLRKTHDANSSATGEFGENRYNILLETRHADRFSTKALG